MVVVVVVMTKVKGSTVRSAQPVHPTSSPEAEAVPDNGAVPPPNTSEHSEHRKKKWNLIKILKPWSWKSSGKKDKTAAERHSSLNLGGEFRRSSLKCNLIALCANGFVAKSSLKYCTESFEN